MLLRLLPSPDLLGLRDRRDAQRHEFMPPTLLEIKQKIEAAQMPRVKECELVALSKQR